MTSTALDNIPAPPSSKLLGWHLLDARPKEGWIRIGFDGKRDFCNPAGLQKSRLPSKPIRIQPSFGRASSRCQPSSFEDGGAGMLSRAVLVMGTSVRL